MKAHKRGKGLSVEFAINIFGVGKCERYNSIESEPLVLTFLLFSAQRLPTG